MKNTFILFLAFCLLSCEENISEKSIKLYLPLIQESKFSLFIEVSRFTLSESEDQDGDKKVDIKSNNSFLHDNVD